MDLTVRLDSLRGEHVGLAKLTLRILVRNRQEHIVKVLNLVTELRAAATEGIPDIGRSSYFIGYGTLESDAGQLTPNSELPWEIGLAMLPYHLQKIEEIRKGGDLFLFVQFLCLAAEMGDSGAPQLRRFGMASVRGENWSGTYVRFKIAQSDWVKLLKDLGYGDYFLIEVPLRGVPSKTLMDKALGHLNSAWGHFCEGRDEDTLVSCYRAFEFLARRRKLKNPDQQAFEKLLQGIAEQDKRRKLASLMHYLCQFFHLGRHEPGQERPHLDRRDSEYALILTQATLAYLAKTMAEERTVEAIRSAPD